MKRNLVLLLIVAVAIAGVMFYRSGEKPAQAPNGNSAPSANSGTSNTAYPKLKLKISTSGTDMGIDAIAANHFAELIKNASDGQITATVYPNCQLAGGSMPKSIELLIAGGNYEMAVFSGSVLGNVNEKLLTHSVPFIFNSYNDASSYMDGTGGAYYTKLFDEKGLVYMSGMHNGLRQLTSNKPVRTPRDLAGLKIRVPSGEVYMRTLSSFKADPVAMNWSEVFTALQQGTINGHENGYQTIDSANIHEVQKYITEWNWSYDGYWLMANKKDWAKFDEATKAFLMDKAQETALWARAEMVRMEEEIKTKFRDFGVEIIELNDSERQVFVDAARESQEYFSDKFGEEASKAWGIKK